MRHRWMVVVILLGALSGCATYKSQIVQIEPIERYQDRVESNGLAAALQPYDTADKTKAAFYIDLTSKNIKPVQMLFENKSDDNILITRSQLVLTDTAGAEVKPVNSNYVYGKFEKNELAYAFWGFGIFSYMSAQDANNKMKADWHEKEFTEEKTLAPHRKISGFVFYETPNHLKGMTLNVEGLNLRTNEPIKLQIPIS